MAGPLIVTGFTPIPNPRPPEEYEQLHAQLFNHLSVPYGSLCVYHTPIQDTWLWNEAVHSGAGHHEGDNAAKNTLAYHCVQHQKFEWMAKAATDWTEDSAPIVWIDYGIAHCPGVTPAVVNAFLAKLEPDDFAMPGCWPKGAYGHNIPCWRFCGGVMVVPRDKVFALRDAVVDAVRRDIFNHDDVTWEVNTLAFIERSLPIRWYEADHNETMFTNYGVDL